MVDRNDPEYLEQKKQRLKSRKEAPDKYTIKWRNFMLLILVCGGGLQVLIPMLLKVWTLAVPSYVHLDITSSSQLQDVFFGGHPWLVWCKEKEGSPYAKHHDALLERVGDYMRGTDIHLGVIDCHAPMPKGDTIITKFKLTTAVAPHPTLVLIANGDRPSVISPSFFSDNEKTPARLLHHVREVSRPTLVKLYNNQDLEKKCINKKSCALILHQGVPSNATLEMLNTLMSRYRLTRFVWTDVDKKQLSNEKALPLVDHGDGDEYPRMLYFARKKEEITVTEGQENDETTKKTTTALYGRAHRHAFDIDKLASFLDHMTGVIPSSEPQHNPVKLTKPPRLYDRRGKLSDNKKKDDKKQDKEVKDKKKEKHDKKKQEKDDKKRQKDKEKEDKNKDKSYDDKMKDAADKARERKRKRDDQNKKEKDEKHKSKGDAEKRDSFHQQHEARQQDELRRAHQKQSHDEWEDEEVVNLDEEQDTTEQEGQDISDPAPEFEGEDEERQHDEL